MLLFERDHVAWAHHAAFLAAAIPYSDAAHGPMPEMAFVFGKFEMRLRLPGIEVGPEAQVLVDGEWIDDFAGIHPVLRVPDRFEFAKRLYQFGTKHLGQHFRLGLSIAVFAGEGAAITDNQIGGILNKRPEVADAFDGAEIEVD